MIQKIRVQTIGKDNVKVYRLEGISKKEARLLAEKLLSEKINQRYTIEPSVHLRGEHMIKTGAHLGGVPVEIAYKPGVMNPEVASMMKAASDLGIRLLAADASVEYVSKKPIFNPLIEHIVITEPRTLIIKSKPGKTQTIKIRHITDDQLM